MKAETLNNMKKAVEVLAAFGDAKNANQIKKYLHLSSVVNKIESTTQKQVVDKVLDTYRPVFNELPKTIKGVAKKAFCTAVNQVLSNKGTLFVFDANGNIVPNRLLRSIRKSDNADLFALLGNLFSQFEILEASAAAKAEDVTLSVDQLLAA